MPIRTKSLYSTFNYWHPYEKLATLIQCRISAAQCQNQSFGHKGSTRETHFPKLTLIWSQKDYERASIFGAGFTRWLVPRESETNRIGKYRKPLLFGSYQTDKGHRSGLPDGSRNAAGLQTAEAQPTSRSHPRVSPAQTNPEGVLPTSDPLHRADVVYVLPK